MTDRPAGLQPGRPSLSSPWRQRLERLVSIDPRNSLHAPDAVTVAALLYIALPNFIFLGGWLRLPWAIAAVLLLCVALGQFLHHTNWRQQPYSAAAFLLIVVAAFLWSSLGGAGHFFYANPDWHVRDTVLGDLVFTAWPPSYSVVDGYHHILRSAIGYFLPAAVIGKLVGIGSVDIALYLWTAIGTSLFLLLLPLPRRAGLPLIILLSIVVAFSGMDYLGIVLVTGDRPIFPLRLEWWVPFSYSSFSGQLLWAPNHALPLWLITALFYRHWGNSRFPGLVTLLLPLLVIWTPFAVAGILPFVAIAVLRWFYQGKTVRDWQLTVPQVLTAIIVTYVSLRLMTLDITAITSGSTADLSPKKGHFVLDYLIFVLMEFAVLGLLIGRQLRDSFGLYWLAFILLAAIPLYHFGPSNDTMLRLSIPCLVILLIATLRLVGDWWAQPGSMPLSIVAPAAVLVLLIGAFTPVNELWRAVTFHRQPPNYGESLVEAQKGFEAPHYVGRLDRSDLIGLLRPPAAVPDSKQRRAQGLLLPASSPK